MGKRFGAQMLLVLIWGWGQVAAQPVAPARVRDMVQQFKKDPRGPYRDIRWFCPDGTDRAARDPCPEKNGVQHARLKPEVLALGRSNHLYLGQVLAGATPDQLWDAEADHSRLKQYQLGRYLAANDNGWIFRRARYYRGAVQEEDEAAWGRSFLLWVLTDPSRIRDGFFFLRQAALDLPHQADDRLAQQIRASSRMISDTFPAFMDLRVKIHGSPDRTDLEKTRAFLAANRKRMPEVAVTEMERLITDLDARWQPVTASAFDTWTKRLRGSERASSALVSVQTAFRAAPDARKHCLALGDLLLTLREAMPDSLSPATRLAMLEVSLLAGEFLLRECGDWVPTDIADRTDKIRCLVRAAAGCGFLETWEWGHLDPGLTPDPADSIPIERLAELNRLAGAAVEWGTSMVGTVYREVIGQYSAFEPLAAGFPDNLIRSSVLLPLGTEASALAETYDREAGLENRMPWSGASGRVRGLNPGYALGELVVVDTEDPGLEVKPDRIYVFRRPPADLKPLAGILSVSEGNLVSHVQLLARNLGIPNAVIGEAEVGKLRSWSGQQMFLAVSPAGTVLFKPAGDMTPEERALVEVRERSEDRIRVPMDRMDLGVRSIRDLSETRAWHSGIWCGPKAANLGELKHHFPDRVVNGLVLPFGLFRAHMDQPMPGTDTTYWGALQGIFHRAGNLRKGGVPESAIADGVVSELAELQKAIRAMPFLDGFEEQLALAFRSVLGEQFGEIPVFVRSDTNMEDLKDFTGAGLNLTLFNVLEPARILQGIRDVWASPYAERSYRWRQNYLLDPENVYPSILIIPSVDADKSGVMITRGVTTGDPDQVTVAFNRGVGGAVEGQMAETWLLQADQDPVLLTPCRERTYTAIPASGGTIKARTSLSSPILSEGELSTLRDMAGRLRDSLDISGALDVELGIRDGQIWLFQVRPFVENKKAAGSAYLLSLVPDILPGKQVAFRNQNSGHD